jgi:hypothetical protein
MRLATVTIDLTRRADPGLMFRRPDLEERALMKLAILMLPALLLLAACDGETTDDLPPEIVNPEPATDETPQPTTRELLEGPRRKIQLSGMPIVVTAPQSWDIKWFGELEFLQGPAIGGTIQIRLSARASVKPSDIELRHQGAMKELEQNPGEKVELRRAGELTILERRSDAGSAAAPAGAREPVRWTINVFVPRGERMDEYELNFIGLTHQLYLDNESLLQSIVNSLAYENPPAVVPGGMP